MTAQDHDEKLFDVVGNLIDQRQTGESGEHAGEQGEHVPTQPRITIDATLVQMFENPTKVVLQKLAGPLIHQQVEHQNGVAAATRILLVEQGQHAAHRLSAGFLRHRFPRHELVLSLVLVRGTLFRSLFQRLLEVRARTWKLLERYHIHTLLPIDTGMADGFAAAAALFERSVCRGFALFWHISARMDRWIGLLLVIREDMYMTGTPDFF